MKSESGTTSQAFTAAKIGPVTLRNRFVKAATFEGVMPNGAVSDELIEFHRLMAAGGVGLTTVAYCSVSPAGRVHRHTMVMSEEILPDLTRLTEAVHQEGAKIAAQIGHAGLVANQISNKVPTTAPSTRISAPAMGLVKAAKLDELAQIKQQYIDAAKIIDRAGFDVIEVHLGHNYLLSSFLSPNLNKRTDQYGGTLEKRARYPREIVAAIRAAVGEHMAVTVKLNMADGPKTGLWLDESLQVARWLEQDGHVDAFELTGGSSYNNSMWLFRGDVPMAEMAATQHPIVGFGMKFVGPLMFKYYPFEEAYFLPFARQFLAALSTPIILLGGINERATVDAALEEGFEFVAMGRALLREPDLVNRFYNNETQSGICIHCNKCMPTIFTGTRCVLEEPVWWSGRELKN